MARLIVRSRDGRKLRNRPVHVTLNGPGEFLNTVSSQAFPASPSTTTADAACSE